MITNEIDYSTVSLAPVSILIVRLSLLMTVIYKYDLSNVCVKKCRFSFMSSNGVFGSMLEAQKGKRVIISIDITL